MNLDYAAIWDLDGVLVDTAELHFQAWRHTLKIYGITLTREYFRKIFGIRNEELLPPLLGEISSPALINEISEYKEGVFRKSIHNHVQILPGVNQWLSILEKRGACQAVASSAPLENVKFLLSETGIRRYISAVVAADDLQGKPDPAVFLKAASLIRVAPSHCLVFEDSPVGVEAARRAGMKCIAVTTTNQAAALSKADIIVDRLDQIGIEAFDKLLGITMRDLDA
jgi:beta-phosphoglucomutase family hydrolase